jgi:capsular polysaccharide biosynthesis protein
LIVNSRLVLVWYCFTISYCRGTVPLFPIAAAVKSKTTNGQVGALLVQQKLLCPSSSPSPPAAYCLPFMKTSCDSAHNSDQLTAKHFKLFTCKLNVADVGKITESTNLRIRSGMRH